MTLATAIEPSIGLERAGGTAWDALVVGAGPAGALAAREWVQLWRSLLSQRQRACLWVTRLLRRAWLTRTAVWALGQWPGLGKPLVRYFNTPEVVEKAEEEKMAA